jgi:hypothetical protein
MVYLTQVLNLNLHLKSSLGPVAVNDLSGPRPA